MEDKDPLADLLSGTMLGELKKLYKKAEADYIKARSGNKSAGVRCRKALNDIRKLMPSLRKEVLSFRPEKDDEE